MSLLIPSSNNHIPNNHNTNTNTNTNDTLDVAIRFSASLPDLLLSISLSSHPHANTCTLKQLIRESLPAEWKTRRIRLICAGKALLDNDLLITSILGKKKQQHAANYAVLLPSPSRLPSRLPSRASTPVSVASSIAPATPAGGGEKDKGKAPVRDNIPSVVSGAATPALPRVYIHCSIGDLTLPPEELEREARVAASADAGTSTSSSTIGGSGNDNENQGPNNATFSQQKQQHHHQPRGFDRLLASGFSASEVASLRLQFLSIQSHTHTPDTMPSPTTLRSMEDAWLDGSESGSTSNAHANANADGSSNDVGSGNINARGNLNTAGSNPSTDAEQSALDDMLLGTAMGFFWPVGCLLWGVREEGIWSTRRKMAVIVGVCLNVIIGLVKYSA